MKKIRMRQAVLSAISVLVLWGCSNFLAEKSGGEQGPGTSFRDIPEGYGTVQVAISQGAARTIIPDSAAVSNLDMEYWFAKDGGGEEKKEPEGAGFILKSGSYTLTVKGFLKEGNSLVAQGEASFTITAGQDAGTVNVTLRPVAAGEGTGSLEFGLVYPAGVTVETLTLAPIVGGGTSVNLMDPAPAASGTDPVTLSGTKSGIPVGYYLLRVALRKGEGALAGKTEVVHIYQNLTAQTALDEYTFTDTDFSAEPAVPGNEDPKFHIYIGFGQSNFEGDNGQGLDAQTNYPWTNPRFQVLQAFTKNSGGGAAPYQRQKGTWYTAQPPLSTNNLGLTPADGFGRYLVERLADEDIRIGVIPFGITGASLNAWEPDTGGNDWIKDQVASGNAETWPVPYYTRYDPDGDIFNAMVAMARQAQEAGVIKGIIIHQGEGGGGNASDGGWDKLLKRIYDRLLQELGLPANSIPLLAGEPKSSSGWAQNYLVKNLDTNYPGIFYCIPAMDLDTVEGIHFSNVSQMTLGRRYGDKMLELLYGGYALNPNITVTQAAAGGTFTVKAGSGAPVQGNISVKAGTEVTLSAAPAEGYVFSSFEITGAGLETDYTTPDIRRFIMPAGAHVTVTAIFDPEGYNRINTRVAPKFRGSMTLSPALETAPQGQIITITTTSASAVTTGDTYTPVVKVAGASGNDITSAVLAANGGGTYTLTMPGEEITVTTIFTAAFTPDAAQESQNVMYGSGNLEFRNDAATSSFSVTPNEEYELEIQYKTGGSAARPIALTVIPGDENWPSANSGFGSVSPYTGSHGKVETYKNTPMVILENTGGEWVTERFTFSAAGDFTTKGKVGDYNLAGVYVVINPESAAGAEAWVNYVSLRRMTGSNPPSRNILGNARFKSGLTHWKKQDSGGAGLQIVTVNAPKVPAYAIWADRD